MPTRHPTTPALALLLAQVSRQHRDTGGATHEALAPLFASPDDAVVGLTFAIRRGWLRARRDGDTTTFRMTPAGERARAPLPRKQDQPNVIAKRLNKRAKHALKVIAERAKVDDGFFEFTLTPRNEAFESQAAWGLMKFGLIELDPENTDPSVKLLRPTPLGMMVAPFVADAPTPRPPGRPRLTPEEREDRRERHVLLMRSRRAAESRAKNDRIEKEVIPAIKPIVVRHGVKVVRAAVNRLAKDLDS